MCLTVLLEATSQLTISKVPANRRDTRAPQITRALLAALSFDSEHIFHYRPFLAGRVGHAVGDEEKSTGTCDSQAVYCGQRLGG